MKNLFDRSSEQEFTWSSKHILFFLKLNQIGPATVEKIIEINPDIFQWDNEYVASQFPNYQKMIQLLPDSIPELAELDRDGVVNFKDKNFPKNLQKMKVNKPLLLWYKGNLNIGDSIAVVGSRNMVPETNIVVQKFVEMACNRNLSIVSGLAKGVDEKAHITALENNTKTVAVLPSSLDNILPSSNMNLAKEIVENGGLLLTEYEPGSPKKPENSNYILRNRIQAGISDAVFIAQSAVNGGTMTTAKHAIDNEKIIITYKSPTNTEEFSGNKLLTQSLNQESFNLSEFTKQQQNIIANKNNVISDFQFENINEIEEILKNI